MTFSINVTQVTPFGDDFTTCILWCPLWRCDDTVWTSLRCYMYFVTLLSIHSDVATCTTWRCWRWLACNGHEQCRQLGLLKIRHTTDMRNTCIAPKRVLCWPRMYTICHMQRVPAPNTPANNRQWIILQTSNICAIDHTYYLFAYSWWRVSFCWPWSAIMKLTWKKTKPCVSTCATVHLTTACWRRIVINVVCGDAHGHSVCPNTAKPSDPSVWRSVLLPASCLES